jgi:hypothetical protein
MDWPKLLSENASALIGLLGVLLGVLLGGLVAAVPAFALALKQRSWALDDQKRVWRRERLAARLAPITEWVDETLRLVSTFEMATSKALAATEVWELAQAQMLEKFKSHQELAATLKAYVAGLSDHQLSALCLAFAKRRDELLEAIPGEKNVVSKMGARLSETAALIHQRVETLLEETFSVSPTQNS